MRYDAALSQEGRLKQDILIIRALFPPIPLMMVNFGNRYTVLANLIRQLHDEVFRDNVSSNDPERFLRQITPPARPVAPHRHHLVVCGDDGLCAGAHRDDCDLF